MQFPHAACVGRAYRPSEQDVEGGKISGAVCGGRKEVIWGQACGMEGAMVAS